MGLSPKCYIARFILIGPLVPGKNFLKGLLYMDMVAILFMRPTSYGPISLTSREKAESLFLKGRLVGCYKSSLSALSILIHHVTHENIRCAML